MSCRSFRFVSSRAHRTGLLVIATLFAGILSTPAISQERQWTVSYVSPFVWHATPQAAIHTYATWYCAQPAAQGVYINCVPDYITAHTFPLYSTRLRLTRVTDGATVYTGTEFPASRTDPVQPPPPGVLKQVGCDGRCPETGDAVTGNPINAGTANKYQVERDYAASGSGGLAFERYYNSIRRLHPLQWAGC